MLKSDLSSEDLKFFSKERLDRSSPQSIDNPSNYKKHYVWQPSGSQNYPDFLFLEEKVSLCVESKYSKNSIKPFWNSGLPRPNGIYIFASGKSNDITFLKVHK